MKKNFEVKTGFLYRCTLELPHFEYGCLVGLHIKEGKRQMQGGGGTDDQPLSDKPPLIQCGETWSMWQ